MLCSACKNKTSTERCANKCLKGLILCGVHAKTKNVRFWKDVNGLDRKATLIQKIWRGYTIRNWLTLSGPGVLKRENGHNEEELVTFDDRKSVYPTDYFAFEESGRTYWFDIRTIYQHTMDKMKPTNPYTREPLTIETRQRLRKLINMRKFRELPCLHQDKQFREGNELVQNAWTVVCQIIEENGFPDMDPMFFIGLNRHQLYIFCNLLHQDTIAWAAEHTKPNSRRSHYVRWTRSLIREFRMGAGTQTLTYMIAKCLTTILNDYPDPYSFCFIIISALYRV